jgi:hypothetical protein
VAICCILRQIAVCCDHLLIVPILVLSIKKNLATLLHGNTISKLEMTAPLFFGFPAAAADWRKATNHDRAPKIFGGKTKIKLSETKISAEPFDLVEV